MKGIERNQLLEEMMKYDTTELEEEEQPEMTDGEVNEFLVHDKRQLNLSNFMDKVWWNSFILFSILRVLIIYKWRVRHIRRIWTKRKKSKLSRYGGKSAIILN